MNRAARGLRPPGLACLLLLCMARPAAAEPCCIGGVCQDVAAGTCVTEGGVPGYCRLGEPCIGPDCDAAAIEEISDLRVAKAGPELHLTFTPEPSSNYTEIKRSSSADGLPDCLDGGELPIHARWSTVDELFLGPAHLPDADLVFLCASPSCFATPGDPLTGACCQADGACNDDVDLDTCHAMGGFFQGVGSRCAGSNCGVVVADATPCLFEENVIYMDGRNGDWVHPGIDTILDAAWTPATLSGDPPYRVSWWIVPDDTDAQGNYWRPSFDTYQLGHELRVGVYEDAQRIPLSDPGRPGLTVTGDHRGCNQIGGRFQILECVIVDGVLRAFSATWHQECEPLSGTDYMDGCIRVKQ